MMQKNSSRTFQGSDQPTSSTVEEERLPLKEDSEIVLLGEIVCASGLGLVQKNHGQSDGAEEDGEADNLKPFASVYFRGSKQPIHETRTCEDRGGNPIWTISTKSLFLIRTTPLELSNRNQLEIKVWTQQTSSLAMTHIARELRNNYIEKGWDSRGFVTLRFRHASASDIAFVSNFYQLLSQDSMPPNLTFSDLYIPAKKSTRDRPRATITTETSETEIAGATLVNALSSAFTYNSYFDKTAGTTKYLVKPIPDPDRKKSTTYLTKDEIRMETMKPSKEWVEAGSGRLGKLYLEILCCHDLPNMDAGGSVGNLTDAFVAAVFEDSMVQTPVIDDELSPHWLPWTSRAFVFGIMNPTSVLYVGCFDYDLGTSHEGIGRVAVNLGNLERNTQHTMVYNLYQSSNMSAREANGTITIRIRIELVDEKAALLAGLQPRPNYHINVRHEKSLQVLKYTCFGEFGDEGAKKFDLKVVRSYIQEIMEHKRFLVYTVVDVSKSLIFWRGQVLFLGIMWPVHSFCFFCVASTLVERPQMFPAFALLSVSWILMAAGTQRQQHPSPWFRCPTFWNRLGVLLRGHSLQSISEIQPLEGAKETEMFNLQWEQRIQQDMDKSNKKKEEKERFENLVGDDNNARSTTMGEQLIPAEWLSKLAWIQGIIADFLRKVRLIKYVVTWEESIVSFWISLCFLALGLVALILPWGMILTFFGRCIVWGLLGPHMMIVDAYFRQAERNNDKSLKKYVEKLNQRNNRGLARFQETSKVKDLKGILFGDHYFRVPNFNLSRHCDRPLPQSFACLEEDNTLPTIANSYIPGQHFFGHMIPRLESEALAFESDSSMLEALAEETIICVDRIQESRKSVILERQNNAQEASMPGAKGFEMVALEKSADTDDQRVNVSFGPGTSLEVGQDSHMAMLYSRRQSTTRQSIQQAYEMVHFDSEAELEWDQQISKSGSDLATLEIRGANRLAIVDAEEAIAQRNSILKRNSLRKSGRMLPGSLQRPLSPMGWSTKPLKPTKREVTPRPRSIARQEDSDSGPESLLIQPSMSILDEMDLTSCTDDADCQSLNDTGIEIVLENEVPVSVDCAGPIKS